MHRDDQNLLSLGPGEGSKVERVKLESQHLRGTIGAALQDGQSHLSEADATLLKFHGSYQQENRDARLERRALGQEKAFQFMVRSRIPGGILTPDQYLAEDGLAGRYGNGTLRITTRQGLQLHGVLKGDLRATIRAINDTLLTTLAACGDVGRNVMACPASTVPEIQEVAAAIAARLRPRTRAYHEIWVDGEVAAEVAPPAESEPLYGATYLPRKFKIGIALPHDNCVDVYTQDVGLIAHVEGRRLAGFNVLVGGGMGMTHGKTETYPRLGSPLCYVARDDAVATVEAIVAIHRDFGDRENRKHARLKYVVEEKGIPWMRAELQQRISHPVSDPRPLQPTGADDHLGWHRLPDGRWFLGIHVYGGRIQDIGDTRTRAGLRAAIERLGTEVRLTPQQNVLLYGVEDSQRKTLESILSQHGIEIRPGRLGTRRDSLACPALPTCGLAMTDAERVLPAVVQQIERDLHALGLAEERISIRMTGCPNGCARPYLGDIGFVGRAKDRYDVYVGGDWANTRMAELYAVGVALSDLAGVLSPLLGRWRAGRVPRETFGDYCHRVGLDALREEDKEVRSCA